MERIPMPDDDDEEDDDPQLTEMLGVIILIGKIKEEVPESDKRHKAIIQLCEALKELINLYAGLSDPQNDTTVHNMQAQIESAAEVYKYITTILGCLVDLAKMKI
jgi:hypothetical protein